MSSDVDTVEDIDLAIEELASALEVPADPEQGAVRLATLALSDEFAMHPIWGTA